MYDWCNVYLMGGIAQIEIWLFIKSARVATDVDNEPIWHDTKEFFNNVNEFFQQMALASLCPQPTTQLFQRCSQKV